MDELNDLIEDVLDPAQPAVSGRRLTDVIVPLKWFTAALRGVKDVESLIRALNELLVRLGA